MTGEQFRAILAWAGIFLAANIGTVILINLVVYLLGGLFGN
jgi:hypothetical protein